MFASLLLYKKEQDGKITELHKYPPTEEDFNESDLIRCCAIPNSLKLNSSTIFVLNNQDFFGYSWAFYFNGTAYAVVILSTFFHPSLFIDFLHAVDESFQETKDISDEMCRFALVQSLLLSWQCDENNNLIVSYPLDTFTIALNEVESWISDFNIAPLYPHVEQVWCSLIINDPVLIVGPTAEVATSAAIAAISLLEPLRYVDPFLLFTQEGDPRYEELKAGTEKYMLVTTTEKNYSEIEKSFKVIIAISATSFDQMTELKTQYQHRTIRYFGSLLTLMDYSLLNDPYFDLMERPISLEQDAYICQQLNDKEFVRRTQQTATFQKWRHRKAIRDQLRQAFLSVSPDEAIAKIDKEKLPQALALLHNMASTYARDAHYLTVLKIHIKKITKLIKKNKLPMPEHLK